MKWKLILAILIIFILLAGCTAPTAPMRGLTGEKGDPGASTIDVNYTFTGVPGSPALVVNVGNITDALLDFTIPEGVNGSGLDTSWNLSYYLRDTSRTLTGGYVTRDVNDETLSIYGGTVTPPYGAHLQLYGGTNVAMNGGAALRIGDAVGNGKTVWSVLGRTDTPTLDLNNNKIATLGAPTNDYDAATKKYVDDTIGTGLAGTKVYYVSDTSGGATTRKLTFINGLLVSET